MGSRHHYDEEPNFAMGVEEVGIYFYEGST